MPQRATKTSFKKGRRNPGHRSNRPHSGAGRKPGTPNKVTADIKQSIVNALNNLGGEAYLETVGRKDMRSFTTLIRAAIPQKLQMDVDPEDVARRIREKAAAMNEATQTKPEEEK